MSDDNVIFAELWEVLKKHGHDPYQSKLGILSILERERLKARLFQHVCDCDKCQGIEYRHVKCPKGMELERELAALGEGR